jgi:hypothetical protein
VVFAPAVIAKERLTPCLAFGSVDDRGASGGCGSFSQVANPLRNGFSALAAAGQISTLIRVGPQLPMVLPPEIWGTAPWAQEQAPARAAKVSPAPEANKVRGRANHHSPDSSAL